MKLVMKIMSLKVMLKLTVKMLKLYNPCNPKTWIIGIDADKSYGYSMSQLLSFEILDSINL